MEKIARRSLLAYSDQKRKKSMMLQDQVPRFQGREGSLQQHYEKGEVHQKEPNPLLLQTPTSLNKNGEWKETYDTLHILYYDRYILYN